jgi:Xaa-Pro dipeptidase
MNASDLKKTKAVDLLEKRGLNGLVIYSNGAFHFLRSNCLHYFSDWRPLGPNNAAIFSGSGQVVLLVEPTWDLKRASEKTWIKDTRGTSDFLNDLTSTIRELNISGPIGVAGSGDITIDVYRAIEEVGETTLADDIIEQIAKEKTPSEVDIARETGKIADIGFSAFFKHARVGIREYELVGEMEFAMRLAGADDNFTLISSGKHNYAMHSASDKRLEPNDIVIGEISPVHNGQVVQICRTIVLGESSKVLKAKYEMLIHALEESKNHIRINNSASAMAIAMNEVISDAGYSKYCQPPYMRARGHGFSLGSVAPGAVIDDKTDSKFEKDQVVVVHPNQYLPETGYLACGESVLVTDSGAERLVDTETKLYSKEV